MRQWSWLLVVLAACTHTCERGQEPVWSSLAYTWPDRPLVVSDDSTFDDALEAAVDYWNDNVGCRLLEYRPNEPAAHVQVSSGAPPAGTDVAKHCPAYGACTAMAYAPVPTAYVYYVSPSTIDVDFCVLAHELGHALGLADDVGRRLSVMGSCADRGAATLVTQADREALYDRYCR